ncbi:hypothetical protein [Actinophytocola sp. NPDC049390]|uniref:hypothetical protein n=1 Tax=Actinophytocola sp. NPDC049390 TaxID=3363894 RepID=UPI0037A978D7
MAVWFAAAVIGHDLVLFPLYSAADHALQRATRRTQVPLVNHVRVPALASELLLLLFLPGIIRQGEGTYLAATGQTQGPFLARWLLLTAAFFTTSATVYAIRHARNRGWHTRRQQCRQVPKNGTRWAFLKGPTDAGHQFIHRRRSAGRRRWPW